MVAIFVPGYGVVGGTQEQAQTRKAPLSGRLYPKNNQQAGLDFPYNPEHISRHRAPQYAEIGAAAADYWQKYEGAAPLQWVRNPPEVVSFELLFSATGNETVEADLKKLYRMASKASSSPRGQSPGPTDLIFAYGKRSDTCRITSMTVEEERHNSQLEVQQARVKLELKIVKMGK